MNRVSANVKEMITPFNGAGVAAIAAAIYLFYKHQTVYIGLGLGVGFLTYAVSNRNLVASILAGTVAAVLAAERRRLEGFSTSETAIEAALAAVKKAAPPDSTAPPPPPPDNGSRGEFFELGKKYKLPSETDDKGFHLDAGTTFMNAYKSLKPDQIAAMTKDTQELMETQKQLMATLNTLKPLMQDGKSMMDTFQSYFGSSGVPTST